MGQKRRSMSLAVMGTARAAKAPGVKFNVSSDIESIARAYTSKERGGL